MSPAANTSVVLSEEVAQAQADGRPVVALESTIITHGMPYPHNSATALLVEDTIREHGATPATIAVIDGRLRAGVSTDELEAGVYLEDLQTRTTKPLFENLPRSVHLQQVHLQMVHLLVLDHSLLCQQSA